MTESETDEATKPSGDAGMEPSEKRALRRLRRRSLFTHDTIPFESDYHLNPSKFDPHPNDRNLEELQPGDIILGILCPRHQQMYRSIENRVIYINLLVNCEYKASDMEERRNLAASLRKMIKKTLEEINAFRILLGATFPGSNGAALRLFLRKDWHVVRNDSLFYNDIFGREEHHLGGLGWLTPESAPKTPTPRPPKRNQVKPPKTRTSKSIEREKHWVEAGMPKGESHKQWLLAGRPGQWVWPQVAPEAPEAASEPVTTESGTVEAQVS